MKNIILSLCLVFAFALSVEACPYQKMAEVDLKLNSNMSNIDSKTFKTISDLKIESKEKLEIGDLDNAEKILDRALALIN
jgi:hypothetical protein